MISKFGRAFARFDGLVFTILGLWVLAINLIERSYSGTILAWVLASGLLGSAGGVFYLLSFDGPERLRTRGVRIAGWIGMLVLAVLPSSLSVPLLALVVFAIPSLMKQPNQGEPGAASAT